jgi:hypothetical protein
MEAPDSEKFKELDTVLNPKQSDDTDRTDISAFGGGYIDREYRMVPAWFPTYERDQLWRMVIKMLGIKEHRPTMSEVAERYRNLVDWKNDDIHML